MITFIRTAPKCRLFRRLQKFLLQFCSYMGVAYCFISFPYYFLMLLQVHKKKSKCLMKQLNLAYYQQFSGFYTSPKDLHWITNQDNELHTKGKILSNYLSQKISKNQCHIKISKCISNYKVHSMKKLFLYNSYSNIICLHIPLHFVSTTRRGYFSLFPFATHFC